MELICEKINIFIILSLSIHDCTVSYLHLFRSFFFVPL